MWKSVMSSETAKSLRASIERTGEAAAEAMSTMAAPNDGGAPQPPTEGGAAPPTPETPLSKRIQKGWGSVVEATKHAVDATREAVEKEQNRLFSAPLQRDPRLPLDKEALRDAEVVYITDRIITMSHPALQSSVDGSITPPRKLAAVAHLLHKRHEGRFMIWNLSEVDYDTTIFEDQVLCFSFPGSPSPPLGLLLKLLMSMESWLKADERNVAVVHCLTGKGRTSTVLAAFLCWVGEAGFSNVHDALLYIAQCKKLSEEDLVIPSQRRYVKYFSNMLDGVRPSQPPLMLKRIIMSEAPKFAKGPPRTTENGAIATADDDDDASLMGCAPYIQIFKAGELLFTTAASVNYQQAKEELPFCHTVDGPVSFQIDRVVQGDILIRGRHLTASGQRVSMFRAAIHTGYVPPKVMRLSKNQLDGTDDRHFSNDFFLDLIFEPCQAETASMHLNDDEKPKEEEENVESKQTTVTASAYDSMLHRDSRFWDVIAARRQEHSQQHASAENEEDPMWGPTIGRKRDLDKKSKNDSDDTATSSSMHAFSIGGEVDFFDSPSPEKTMPAQPKKRDELMEALMALDDEPHGDIEEIVFEDTADSSKAAATPPPEPKPTIVELPPPKAATPKPEEKKETPKKEPATEEPKEEAAKQQAPAAEEVEPKESKTVPAAAPPVPDASSSTAAVDSASESVSAAASKDADVDTDDDLDALLASAGDDADGLADDLNDLDFDDDDLEDLENLLNQTK